ncbi:LysR substrate-binding domain-containing protein [Paenibacillus sacheonensis]|uniref:LysR family transcriptional regulator n=1 Tax=Paenibacillus sacheonensis TaxID=742054 RepID=A0A7X5C1L4_9BACL|nr:DNA-binding transcriptional LysR family regulator [Paenibacillus sacheonensis]NBC72811.1 LysR family transcriptional regulator [Paenibacillus sacheonensis]
MNQSQLSLFVQIAESGSFTKAGQELNMTQPAVSRAIAALEAELDVTLLIRDRKNGVLLTDVGKRLLVHCRSILNGYEKIKQEIKSEKGFEVGTVRIGTFPAVSARYLPAILRVIGERYPGITFTLHEGTIDDIRSWLESRVVDVGWIIPPSGELETVPFLTDKLYLLLREDHPLLRQEIIAIRDLDDAPLILCRGGYEVPLVELFAQSDARLRTKFQSHNINTAVSMVQEGLGIAIVSDSSMAMSHLPPNVRMRAIEPMPVREIMLAVPSMKDASLAVKLFMKTARELFAVPDDETSEQNTAEDETSESRTAEDEASKRSTADDNLTGLGAAIDERSEISVAEGKMSMPNAAEDGMADAGAGKGEVTS